MMANLCSRDTLIQAQDIDAAVRFYHDVAGLSITHRTDDLISLEGPQLNLYLHRGPVLELLVDNVAAARDTLMQEGGRVLLDDHTDTRRLYIQD